MVPVIINFVEDEEEDEGTEEDKEDVPLLPILPPLDRLADTLEVTNFDKNVEDEDIEDDEEVEDRIALFVIEPLFNETAVDVALELGWVFCDIEVVDVTNPPLLPIEFDPIFVNCGCAAADDDVVDDDDDEEEITCTLVGWGVDTTEDSDDNTLNPIAFDDENDDDEEEDDDCTEEEEERLLSWEEDKCWIDEIELSPTLCPPPYALPEKVDDDWGVVVTTSELFVDKEDDVELLLFDTSDARKLVVASDDTRWVVIGVEGGGIYWLLFVLLPTWLFALFSCCVDWGGPRAEKAASKRPEIEDELVVDEDWWPSFTSLRDHIVRS